MMLAAAREGMNEHQKAHMMNENLYSESSSSSDDEFEEGYNEKENEVKRSMARYKRPITSNTMKVSYYVRILAFAVFMVAIPLELVLRNIIFDAERRFIVNFQSAFSHGFFNVFAQIVIFFGEVLFIEALAVFLYLFADPLLGFKISIVTFFGIFGIAFIKLMYMIPRPYWKFPDIIGKKCNFDFSGPSDHAFLTTFFYSYMILIFAKYAEKQRPKLTKILLVLNALFTILIVFCMNLLGNTFLFEGLIGVIYGVLYCVICISLDTEIHAFCEKTAFILKSSRKYKFKLFFLCLILFVIVIMYFNAALASFKVDHQWILNTIDDCHNDDSYEYRMGIDFTFQDTAVIFGIIGAGFGASTATMTIENILWSETALWKRVCRGIIGAAVIILIFFVLGFIPHEDHPTKYFFNSLLPHLLSSYCAFGLVPILSKYIGLVNRGSDDLSSSFVSQASFKLYERSQASSGEEGSEHEDLVQPLREDLVAQKHEEVKAGPVKRFKSHDVKGTDESMSGTTPLLENNEMS